jgi:hypothetical protein
MPNAATMGMPTGCAPTPNTTSAAFPPIMSVTAYSTETRQLLTPMIITPTAIHRGIGSIGGIGSDTTCRTCHTATTRNFPTSSHSPAGLGRERPGQPTACPPFPLSRIASPASGRDRVEAATGPVGRHRVLPAVLDPPRPQETVQRRIDRPRTVAGRLTDPQTPRGIIRGRAHDDIQNVQDHQRDPETRRTHGAMLRLPHTLCRISTNLAAAPRRLSCRAGRASPRVVTRRRAGPAGRTPRHDGNPPPPRRVGGCRPRDPRPTATTPPTPQKKIPDRDPTGHVHLPDSAAPASEGAAALSGQGQTSPGLRPALAALRSPESPPRKERRAPRAHRQQVGRPHRRWQPAVPQ